MARVMAVSFERYGRLYYLDPGERDYSVGDRVLVPTDSGPEVAECVWAPEWVDEDGFSELPVCAGLAGPEQLARDAANRRRRAEAKLAAKKSTHKKYSASGTTVHVKRGDTLRKIAKRNSVKGGWKGLWKLNKKTIKNPNLIYIGQTIKIK